MQTLLEAGQVDVEPKDLRREWILTGKFLRALDPKLPGGDGHRAIIMAVENWSNLTWQRCQVSTTTSSGLTPFRCQMYSLRILFGCDSVAEVSSAAAATFNLRLTS